MRSRQALTSATLVSSPRAIRRAASAAESWLAAGPTASGPEGFARRRERGLDLCGAVRGRHEPGFVRRGREAHAALQHFVEEAIEALAVALHDLGKAERRRLAEVQAEHAADALGGERHAGLSRFAGE